jgi:hypothetical protein
VHESSRQVLSDESKSETKAGSQLASAGDVKVKTELKEAASEVKAVKQEVADKSAAKEGLKRSAISQPSAVSQVCLLVSMSFNSPG